MKKILILIPLLACLISCQKNENGVLEWQYGKNVYNMEMDDTLRNFLVHVPTAYNGNEEVPLVLMLHGSSGSGSKFYNISGWVEKADEMGFIAAFPTGLEYPIVEKNNKPSTKWSSGGLEKDIPPGYPIKDDVPFIRELVEACINTFSIDPSRVYISGFSNGGGFVRSRVVPEMTDVFAAASSGGGIGMEFTFTPLNGRNMPVFSILGSKDDAIMESAGLTEEIPLDMDEVLAMDVFKIRIDNFTASLQLGSDYVQMPSPPAYNLITWDNDLSGQGNEMKVLLVNDMTHVYPNGNNNPRNLKATDFLYDWFLKFSL